MDSLRGVGGEDFFLELLEVEYRAWFAERLGLGDCLAAGVQLPGNQCGAPAIRANLQLSGSGWDGFSILELLGQCTDPSLGFLDTGFKPLAEVGPGKIWILEPSRHLGDRRCVVPVGAAIGPCETRDPKVPRSASGETDECTFEFSHAVGMDRGSHEIQGARAFRRDQSGDLSFQEVAVSRFDRLFRSKFDDQQFWGGAKGVLHVNCVKKV